jgi:hypothetical protein
MLPPEKAASRTRAAYIGTLILVALALAATVLACWALLERALQAT